MKIRESNFEVLRIISIAMVLTLHAMFFPWREAETAKSINLFAYLGINTVYSLSYVAVNVFVLISGWFGIKTTRVGLSKLLYQTFFCGIIVYIALLFFTENRGIVGFLEALYLVNGGSAWFVKAYIMLFLLAPALNFLVERFSQKQLRNWLLFFFTFEFLLGWIFVHSTEWFAAGYSPVSFIGLYLLGRYLRLYVKVNRQRRRLFGMIYVLPLALCAVFGAVVWKYLPDSALAGIASKFLYSYVSPMMVVGAVGLLLFTATFSFKSAFINKVAISVLSVYLIQEHALIRDHYISYSKHLFEQLGGIECVAAFFLLISLTFVGGVLIDQIRLWSWNKVSPAVHKLLSLF